LRAEASARGRDGRFSRSHLHGRSRKYLRRTTAGTLSRGLATWKEYVADSVYRSLKVDHAAR
jgi:hypothetical protein